MLEERCLLAAPVIDPVQVQLNLPAGKSLIVPISAADPAGGSISYTLTPAAGSQVTATQLTGNFVTLTTQFGVMEFELFTTLTPNTTALIEGFIKAQFYDGLTFHRIAPGFAIQGGDPAGNGTGGPGFTFDDEFNPDLIYSGNGQLAMANSGPDTNGSQFFISIGPQRGLDFNNAIFGQLIRGFDVLNTIDSQPNSGPPNNTATPPVPIISMQIVQDTTDAVFLLKSTGTTTGPVSLTLTATASTGGQTTQTLTAQVFTDTTNDPPFLNPSPANAVAPAGSPFTLNLTATDIDSGALTFEAVPQGANTSQVTVTPGATNGSFTITPNDATFKGAVEILAGVEQQGATSRGNTLPPATLFDTQLITIAFGDQTVTATGTAVSATEGSTVSNVQVATFTDADTTAVADDFTASINWGDGTAPDTTTPNVTITGSAGSFTVTGTHTYKEAGKYPIKVVITDTGSAANTDNGGAIATGTATATVNEAALSATGVAVNAVQDTAFTRVPVATFTDANLNAGQGDFTASINWGDNTPATTGIITAQGAGMFTVLGNHTYANPGSFNISVNITDATAGDVPNFTTSASSTATVTAVSANQRFVRRLYQNLLNRLPDAQGLQYFTAVLDLGLANRFQVTLAIEASFEHRIDQVTQAFNTFLGRPPDTPTGSRLVVFLGQGGTVSQMDVILTNTPEYFQNHGGNSASGFASALFTDGLKRSIDTTTLNNFLQTTSGLSREKIADLVFSSPEFQQDIIQGVFNQFLNHPADANALSIFTQILQEHNLHDEFVVMTVGGSPEFFGLV
jgi:cyclophilin family peptidyl-prolyl cis-trans isomerase